MFSFEFHSLLDSTLLRYCLNNSAREAKKWSRR